jgi:hypothetical protein
MAAFYTNPHKSVRAHSEQREMAGSIAIIIEALMEERVKWDLMYHAYHEEIMVKFHLPKSNLSREVAINRLEHRDIECIAKHCVQDFRDMKDDQVKKKGYAQKSKIEPMKNRWEYEYGQVSNASARSVVDQHLTKMQQTMQKELMMALGTSTILVTKEKSETFAWQKKNSYDKELQSRVDNWLK